jgi:myosin heavy subunit
LPHRLIARFVGSVLLAVNPYKLIPRLYGEAPMKARQSLMAPIVIDGVCSL